MSSTSSTGESCPCGRSVDSPKPRRSSRTTSRTAVSSNHCGSHMRRSAMPAWMRTTGRSPRGPARSYAMPAGDTEVEFKGISVRSAGGAVPSTARQPTTTTAFRPSGLPTSTDPDSAQFEPGLPHIRMSGPSQRSVAGSARFRQRPLASQTSFRAGTTARFRPRSRTGTYRAISSRRPVVRVLGRVTGRRVAPDPDLRED